MNGINIVQKSMKSKRLNPHTAPLTPITKNILRGFPYELKPLYYDN